MVGRYADRQLRASEVVDTRSVLIPQNWADLDDSHVCSVASQLAGKPIHSATTAKQIIRGELKRRG